MFLFQESKKVKSINFKANFSQKKSINVSQRVTIPLKKSIKTTCTVLFFGGDGGGLWVCFVSIWKLVKMGNKYSKEAKIQAIIAYKE